MFSSRRLAKRSILGTKIAAPWQDGRFYPGSIQGTETAINGDEYYTIFFDSGHTKTLEDRDLIGPGFQPITVAKLKVSRSRPPLCSFRLQVTYIFGKWKINLRCYY